MRILGAVRLATRPTRRAPESDHVFLRSWRVCEEVEAIRTISLMLQIDTLDVCVRGHHAGVVGKMDEPESVTKLVHDLLHRSIEQEPVICWKSVVVGVKSHHRHHGPGPPELRLPENERQEDVFPHPD